MELRQQWIDHLVRFREQGMRIGDINPIAALADIICEQLHGGEIRRLDLSNTLDALGDELWRQQTSYLQLTVGITDNHLKLPKLDELDITQLLYRAVFTAHPTFVLNSDVSAALCSEAELETSTVPKNVYGERQAMSLQHEHDEAMGAICNARQAISKLNGQILEQLQTSGAQAGANISHKFWEFQLGLDTIWMGAPI